MSERDCSKQAQRRQKITKKTLIIGMDIGSEFNAMALMNEAGEVIGRYPKVYNSRGGFESFREAIEVAKREKSFRTVLIGMEPTGHYWRKIAYFAKECGYDVRFIRTTALRHQRELDESSSAKTDIRDAVTIANIVREGKYIDTVIEDGVYRQLRMLAHVRENIQRYNVGTKHRLAAVLDDYFPELRSIFWSMKAKGLWAVLETCPLPSDVLKRSVEQIAELIGKSSRRKGNAVKKAKQIYEGAKESIGLKEVSEADRYRLRSCLEEIKKAEGQLKDVEDQMEGLLKDIPAAEILMSIRGVGLITTAVFLGELGDPKNFTDAKQIVKYAGYDPQEDDSGKSVGRKKISKKGRWLFRKYLFFMGMRVIHRNAFFRKYYDRKLKKKNRWGQLLKKKEALCAVVIKLIKVIFALLRDNRKFSVERPVVAAI
ncbi:MAG: IS110 family transposase [Candidatus Omnitrophica bacterium]|nr:IS110 family transposase [Candidatus Omnitrophota bacterium]